MSGIKLWAVWIVVVAAAALRWSVTESRPRTAQNNTKQGWKAIKQSKYMKIMSWSEAWSPPAAAPHFLHLDGSHQRVTWPETSETSDQTHVGKATHVHARTHKHTRRAIGYPHCPKMSLSKKRKVDAESKMFREQEQSKVFIPWSHLSTTHPVGPPCGRHCKLTLKHVNFKVRKITSQHRHVSVIKNSTFFFICLFEDVGVRPK